MIVKKKIAAQPAAEKNATTGTLISYAYKPLAIGKVIENIAYEKRITPRELARRLGVNHRNVYRLFKSRSMAIPMLFKISEALGVNLLLQYHPNVPPDPNPLQAENAQLKKENAELIESLLQLQAAAEENKMLKAQLEVLREVMKAK